MSVEQIDVIDFISLDVNTGDVTLTIADHLLWGTNEHLYTLQEKINSYLRFVESGEILESYPEAKDKEVTIQLIYKYEPVESDLRFLRHAEQVLSEAGFKFAHSRLELLS